jgi:Uma2 family endonuclease
VFEPGSTGWSASDLDDPRIEAEWFKGRFEIIEGVIARMPPAYLYTQRSLRELVRVVEAHLAARGITDGLIHEVDLVIDESRVLICDVMLVTADLLASQLEAAKAADRDDVEKTRILVPPKLIIESVSPGHERHDTVLKKRWYAEFGVADYWILDAFARSLTCYSLKGAQYEVDCQGRDEDELRPSVFAPLVIPLKDLWRPLSKP